MQRARLSNHLSHRARGAGTLLAGIVIAACASPAEGGGEAQAAGAALGGAPTSGGVGGTTGGSSTGGVPSTGGASTTGGLAASGGLATGGSIASGGGTGTGGSAGTGGSIAGAGGTGAGGALTGGVSGGGAAMGGVASGGWATGGIATGGWVTGGAATGGTATGGDATGGWVTGGVAAGGVAAGGEATGGAGGADASTPITIWIAGDSTVANGSTPCPAGWGKYFAPLFNDLVTVKNSAIGGRSVRNWLFSVSTTMGTDGECVLNTDASGAPVIQAHWQAMLDGMSDGDYLFVQFGINDGSATCDRHVGVDAFKAEYAMMAAAARERGAHPVFVTPVSAVACDGSSARTTRDTYANATIEVGADEDVPVIDLHRASVDLYDELGFCPIPGGDVSAITTGPVGDFFCDDHTHFSATGAPVIAGLVADAVRAQGLALSAYLE